MALIIAVVGSVLGVIAGLVNMLLFGASVVLGLVTYLVVSIGMIVACAISVALSHRAPVAAGSTFEDMLDDTWTEAEALDTSAHSKDESSFQNQLDAPLGPDEIATEKDRDSA